MFKITLVALAMLISLVIMAVFPLGVIWALNTLFNLSIQYTFWNWVAINILIAFFNVRLLTVTK